jgi:hypothetical protein
VALVPRHEQIDRLLTGQLHGHDAAPGRPFGAAVARVAAGVTGRRIGRRIGRAQVHRRRVAAVHGI